MITPSFFCGRPKRRLLVTYFFGWENFFAEAKSRRNVRASEQPVNYPILVQREFGVNWQFIFEKHPERSEGALHALRISQAIRIPHFVRDVIKKPKQASHTKFSLPPPR
jgi:hypothetical protein